MADEERIMAYLEEHDEVLMEIQESIEVQTREQYGSTSDELLTSMLAKGFCDRQELLRLTEVKNFEETLMMQKIIKKTLDIVVNQ